MERKKYLFTIAEINYLTYLIEKEVEENKKIFSASTMKELHLKIKYVDKHNSLISKIKNA